MSKGKSFWARIAATSLLYNLPLALGYLMGVLSLPVVVVLSAAGATASLVVWDRPKQAEQAWEQSQFDVYA